MGFTACPNDDSIGPSVEGCRDDFDFTLTFERVFLSILPSVIFIVLSIPRITLLLRKPAIVGGVFFQCTKLAAFVLYTVLQLVILVLNNVGTVKATQLSNASSALTFTAALCMSGLSFHEHSRSPRPSVLLNTFLALSLLFDAAQARSLWLSAYGYHDVISARLFTAAAVWKVILILLESRQKSAWLRWDRKDHSPEETSGFYGLATFFWLNPLFISGYKKALTMSDLFALDFNMSVEALQARFFRRIDAASFHGQKYGLARSLASTLIVPFMLAVAPRVVLIGFVFCQPFLLEALMSYLNEPEADRIANRGYGLIGATILIYTGIPTVTAFYWYFQERFLCMARASLAAAVYRKTIQAKISTSDDSAALTLMSADIERIRMGFMQFHEFWANPIQVALACWLLQRRLGAAFAAPIVVVAICVACSTVLMRFVGPRQMAWMKAIQKRVGHMANVVGNMKHLKISGLEGPVEDAVHKLRLDELDVGGKFRTFIAGSVGIGFTPILLAPVFTFAVTSRTLDVTTIYTSISYLLLLSEPLSTLFQLAPQLLAGFACLERVQNFLEKESRHDFRKRESPSHLEISGSGKNSSLAIKIIDGSFGWNEETFALKNINASIPSGLTMVIGPVASGKSTLCKALLGETPISRGEVIMGVNCRTVGYCEQVPFLWNASIRDNIIGFSTVVDEARYAAVIEATMLSQDLRILPRGDRTKVGSDGIGLSGGQKQRISIARALYRQCDLLIFDDVFSGLDADTQEHVFRRVFGPAGVLKERGATAVLCTHFVRHLQSADHIIVLAADGTLTEEGTFDRLVDNGKETLRDFAVSSSPNGNVEINEASTSALASTTETDSPISRINTMVSTDQDNAAGPARIMGDTAVFGYYFRSIGAFWVIIFAVCGVVCGFFYNFPTVWLKYWSEDVSSSDQVRSTSFYIGLYALYQCLALGSLMAGATVGLIVVIRASGTSLHKSALRAVFAAPLRFFTTTDTGVVTNLFSQDMTLVDGELPQALINTSIQGWIGLGMAAVVATSSPYVTIAYPFVIAILYCIQRFYLRTSRQLRLLDLEAKSPLYTNFLDTIKGLATFRAFDWTHDAIRLNSLLLDTSQRPAYLLSMVQRWLAFVLGMVVAVIALFVVTLSTQLRSNAGFAGASMVSLMSFGKTLANVVQMYTLLETSIGAVGRLKSFSENTDREDLPGEDVVPPASWPDRASVEIKGVSASYSHPQASSTDENSKPGNSNSSNLALQDLSLTIESGQKVALCGRTGSGKSSVVLLLLRLLDPLPSCTGSMFIDGLSLHTMDRATLRRRVIAVPQDPVFLPDGTSFKTNLDPFDVATDGECQGVLETVRLWAMVCDRGGLEAGMNADTLSQGQKQLFSLARAVLRRRVRTRELLAETGEAYLTPGSAINDGMELQPVAQPVGPSPRGGLLILDEFSSSVDKETEKEMQQIIRREFESYTILMISHRLEMVMGFDKVLVMDAGKVVEQGVPRELAEQDGSRFKHLWTLGRNE